MKKGIFIVLGLCLFTVAVLAMGNPAPKTNPEGSAPAVSSQSGEFLIENFESGSLRSPREWWTFDIKTAEPESNSSLTSGEKDAASQVGKYSLKLKGDSTNWYAGGCGTYLAKENQDLSKYNTFRVDVYGNGPGSGTVKIELYDDDNGNWQAEQDPSKSYAPIYDDKYVHDIMVDWLGWKRISVPFDDFVDDNPTVGDNIWNPAQNGASGGLLQLQMICIAPKEKGEINFSVDNIILVNE